VLVWLAWLLHRVWHLGHSEVEGLHGCDGATNVVAPSVVVIPVCLMSFEGGCVRLVRMAEVLLEVILDADLVYWHFNLV
jgi:hypothetical protein